MNREVSPFEATWWMSGLVSYRSCQSTYCQFDYDRLPPLNTAHLDGSFDWLMPEESLLERMAPYYDVQTGENIRRELPIWQAVLADNGITLPPTFITLMQSPERLRAIPSCTACYFELIPPIPSPLGDGAWVLSFLFDQQIVLIWSLYLTPDGDHAVVVEPDTLAAWEEGRGYAPTAPDAYRQQAWLVGEDFESFLYRFWFENRLWFRIVDGDPLSAEEQAYLDHYVAHA